jgi:hypothetical protein
LGERHGVSHGVFYSKYFNGFLLNINYKL